MTVKHRVIKNPSGYHSKGRTHREKVENFAAYLKELEWHGDIAYDDDSQILKLTAMHGDNEKIEIEWPDNQWWPDVWYSYAGDTIKCRNISHAAKLAKDPPDPERMRTAAARRLRGTRSGTLQGASGAVGRRNGVGVGKDDPSAVGVATGDIDALKTSLPWDIKPSKEEVITALRRHRNPTITWVNRLTGRVHTGLMRTGKRHNKVTTNKDGDVIISFTDEFGFHAVYVKSIIGMS